VNTRLWRRSLGAIREAAMMSLVHPPTLFSVAVGAVMTFIDWWLYRRHARPRSNKRLVLVRPSFADYSDRRGRLIPHGYDFFGTGPFAA